MNDRLEYEHAYHNHLATIAKISPTIYGALTLLVVFAIFVANVAFASALTLYGTAILATLGTLAMFVSAITRE